MSKYQQDNAGFWAMFSKLFDLIADIDKKLEALRLLVYELRLLIQELQTKNGNNEKHLLEVQQQLEDELKKVDEKFNKFREIWLTYRPYVYLVSVCSVVGAAGYAGWGLVMEVIKKILTIK